MKSVKIPKKLEIFGRSCPIRFVKDLKCDDNEPVDGLFCDDKFEISLDAAIKHDHEKLFRTLLHEMGHALLFRLYINDSMPRDIEEAIVEGYQNLLLETFLIDFL